MGRLAQDRKNESGNWVKTFREPGSHSQYVTRSAMAWYHMKDRCNPLSNYQKLTPSYSGCSISEEFEDFQYFANWYTVQTGYGFENYELDKDLLVEGNKIYSPDLCVLIPSSLNSFLNFKGASRGEYPIGVSKRNGKYVCQMSFNGGHIHLGIFNTPDDAYKKYKEAKENFAKIWYERLLNKEFIVDTRVIERMKNWTLPKILQG